MAASTIPIFLPIFSYIDDACTQYIGVTTTNVIVAIKPVVMTLATLVITFYGWAMICGLVQHHIMDAVVKGLRISFVATLVTKVGYYNEFIADWLWRMPEALAKIVINGAGTNAVFPAGSSDIAANFLDDLMGQFFAQGTLFWEQAGVTDFGLYIFAILIWGFGFAVTCFVGYLMMLSKLALAVLLGIGPIFILFTLFDTTKKFFDAWMGQVTNYIILNMVTAAVAGLMLSMIFVILGHLSNASGVVNGGAISPVNMGVDIVHSFPLIGACFVTCLFLYQVPSLASALAGGVAISTLGAGGVAYKMGKTKYDSYRKNRQEKPKTNRIEKK